MSLSRSAVYRRKRIGPRTDPLGTPHSSDDVVEQDPLYHTEFSLMEVRGKPDQRRVSDTVSYLKST